MIAFAVLTGTLVGAQAQESEDKWRFSVEVGGQYAVETNLFWNLSEEFAPDTVYDPDRDWWEGYLKPKLGYTDDFAEGRLDVGLSVVASATQSADPYDIGSTSRFDLETAYIAYERKIDDLVVDVAIGAQEYRVGSGMLIANGAANGFERGSLKLGPRKAWEFAGVASLSSGGLKTEVFYVDPNELTSNNTNTRIAGAVIEYDDKAWGGLGANLGHVVGSTAPYPQAAPGGIGAPTVLPNARDGLTFLNLFGQVEPGGDKTGFYASLDLTFERHDRIDMRAWAGRVELGYRLKDSPWSPDILYSFQTFSGDDPTTPRLERFDPLYYEGSPGAWGSGSKASMVFINTNVQAHQVEIAVKPTLKTTATFYFSHLRANQLGSPLQFGQATRVGFQDGVPVLFTGVRKKALSNDFFLKITQALKPNLYLTGGVSMSLPSAGVKDLTNNNSSVWSGAFINLVGVF